MECPACGTENREGARFCRRCGMALRKGMADRAAAPEEARPVPEAPVAGPEAGLEAGASGLREGETWPEEEEGGGMAPGAGPEEGPEEAAAGGAEEAAAEMGAEQAPLEGAAAEAGAEGMVDEGPAPVAGEPGLPLAEGAELPEMDDDEELSEIDDDVLGFWREAGEPLQPVEMGTVVADRYQVMEALDVQEATILYQARDLARCWQCGFEDNARGDAFCASCGAALDRKPEVQLLEVRDGEVGPLEGQEVAERLAHAGRTFLLLAGKEPKPEVETPRVQGIRLLVGQRSDAGQVRELNEDSLLVLTMVPTYEGRITPVLGLFALADGMGGHEGGEIASKIALQVLGGQVMRKILLPEVAGELLLEENLTALLRRATIAANDAVYLARQKRGNDMGTTLTVALVRDERLFLAHVGDCRGYRWDAEGLEQLTTDHSVVASMIAEGRAAPEEIYSHPHRSIVYRCVGDKPTVEVDTDMLPLAPGARIILCSDGLWEMVRDEGIEDVMMQEADPQAACDLLIKHANLAGGEDNISVIVVQVETVVVSSQ
jgi:serine/threonine protein phosphatase PrpC